MASLSSGEQHSIFILINLNHYIHKIFLIHYIYYISMMLISNLILSVAETDSGRYDCLYNGQLVSSFHIAVDSHRLVFV